MFHIIQIGCEKDGHKASTLVPPQKNKIDCFYLKNNYMVMDKTQNLVFNKIINKHIPKKKISRHSILFF